MPLTAEQKEWTAWLFGTDTVLDGAGDAPAAARPGAGAKVKPVAEPDAQTLMVTDEAAQPDARLAALYGEMQITAAPGGLTDGASCWSPKLGILAAWTAVIGAGAGTVALVLAPDPTTLTKWAALGAAAALVGALVGLVAAYGALADCLQSAKDAEENKREIEALRRQQRATEKTVNELKRLMGSR